MDDGTAGEELLATCWTTAGDASPSREDRRRYCGEGPFDLPGIVAALRTAGWSGPWGVEILSTEHRRLDVRQAAAHAATTARNFLQADATHR